MKKARSRSSRTRLHRPFRRQINRRGGFTLVEVLVSMTVLILIIAMLAQVVQHTTSSIQRSTKGMDSNQLSTMALDRIGNSITGMLVSNQGTLVAVKNASASDGLAMVTNGRVRSREAAASSSPASAAQNINVNSFTEIRMSARGFCVIGTPDTDLPPTSSGGPFPSVLMLNWGDGTVKWPTPAPSATPSSASPYVRDDPLQSLAAATGDVINQMIGSNIPQPMLQFSPLSRSIFRFEVCFLLSDGSLISTTTPPLNKHLISSGPPPVAPVTLDTPPSGANLLPWPLAFTADDSNYPRPAISGTSPQLYNSPLYVRAVVVGIASLDIATKKLLTADQINTLAGTSILRKTLDGQTPSQTWDISSASRTTYQNIVSAKLPPPVLQNIRFTQRYFYVN